MPLPVKPTRAELLAITALAQTDGPALLGNALARVRNDLAECGTVVVVQRVLFSNESDAGIGRGETVARLQEARPLLKTLCRKFPGVFLSQAQTLLELLRARPRLVGQQR